MSEFTIRSEDESTVYLIAPIPDPEWPPDLRETAKLYPTLDAAMSVLDNFSPATARLWRAKLVGTHTYTLTEAELVEDEEAERHRTD